VKTEQTELDTIQPKHVSRALEASAMMIPTSFEGMWQIASMFTKSGMFSEITTTEKAMVVLMAGLDLGISPSVAIRTIPVIKNRPSPSAQVLLAVMKNRRDICLYFICIESDENHAIFETHRVGDPMPQKCTYTMDDAKKAGFYEKNPNYKSQPKIMLQWRCVTILGRTVYPDIINGLYTPDEVAMIGTKMVVDKETGDIVDAEYSTPGSVPEQPKQHPSAVQPPVQQKAQTVTPPKTKPTISPKAEELIAKVKDMSPEQRHELIDAITIARPYTINANTGKANLASLKTEDAEFFLKALAQPVEPEVIDAITRDAPVEQKFSDTDDAVLSHDSDPTDEGDPFASEPSLL
jgi:hypothetical protein